MCSNKDISENKESFVCCLYELSMVFGTARSIKLNWSANEPVNFELSLTMLSCFSKTGQMQAISRYKYKLWKQVF